MDELKLKIFTVGDLLNNCYVIFSEKSKKSFIVDCSAPTDEIYRFIDSNNIDVCFIALTHGHFDHISGLMTNEYPFYIHESDSSSLDSSEANGSAHFLAPFVVKRKPNLYGISGGIQFEDYSIEVIHTPGHTPGSISLRLNDWLFSGDTLFFNSIGRTDIPLASEETIIKSIKEKIFTLPPATLVYPGHGPSTTVKAEKEGNPFLK